MWVLAVLRGLTLFARVIAAPLDAGQLRNQSSAFLLPMLRASEDERRSMAFPRVSVLPVVAPGQSHPQAEQLPIAQRTDLHGGSDLCRLSFQFVEHSRAALGRGRRGLDLREEQRLPRRRRNEREESACPRTRTIDLHDPGVLQSMVGVAPFRMTPSAAIRVARLKGLELLEAELKGGRRP